jgi:catechol 2,3-dioxygenase-like lactoylglutathione lyase family enzyme
MFERYSFVAITTVDLYRARGFWVDTLGFPVTEEQAGRFFIVDVGGLRLCVDLADDEIHKVGGSDPVIGLKVQSVSEALRQLAARGIKSESRSETGGRGNYATILDPDGHTVIITESD